MLHTKAEEVIKRELGRDMEIEDVPYVLAWKIYRKIQMTHEKANIADMFEKLYPDEEIPSDKELEEMANRYMQKHDVDCPDDTQLQYVVEQYMEEKENQAERED